ncbi:MAG: DUF4926 domain-containing protein [Gammaproteobacteria bacterium]|nr:DUF4926 domain-containing protein [Gammaproteobacteria bacterium]
MKLDVLDTIVLLKDLPEKNLCRGDIGAIVEMYSPDGIEVEFVTGTGQTQALVTLKTKDVRLVSGSDILAVRSLDAA